jgi:hypothetical protein
MKGLDESKYTIEWVFEYQKASDIAERLLLTFHDSLTKQLYKANLDWSARTHKIGIAYLCGKKVFIWANVYQEFVSLKFFTGENSIKGLNKANWNYKDDKIGSETFRIVDSDSLRQAVDFALKAYEIALDWSR